MSRFENQFLRPPVQNFRDIEFVFRRTCYLVDPPELPYLLAGFSEHAQNYWASRSTASLPRDGRTAKNLTPKT